MMQIVTTSVTIELSQEKRNDTSPLLLDSVDIPIVEPSCTCNHILTTQCKKLIQSARRERDNALMIARQCRNIAEECQTEKRTLKQDLEERIEVVCTFWRNKVVEGGS